MRLSQKLAKVFSGEALLSARRQMRRTRLLRPMNTEVARLKAKIDLARFDQIRRKYELPTAGDMPNKYVQLEHWLRINLLRVRDLGLDRSEPLRILDLGCGAGYFLFIAKLYGHDVLGLDIDEFPLYAETTALFDVPRIIWRIEPFVRLPDLGRKFDLISAQMICFNGHNTAQLWRVAEWEFFLNDIATRLNPNGRIHLSLNRERNGLLYTPELKEYFLARGADIHTERVVFAPLRANRASANASA